MYCNNCSFISYHRDAWSCEHTLDKIEEKILNFEVTDLNVLMSSIRCLVAIYVSLTNERNLNEKVSLILDKLRKSTVISLIFTNFVS